MFQARKRFIKRRYEFVELYRGGVLCIMTPTTPFIRISQLSPHFEVSSWVLAFSSRENFAAPTLCILYNTCIASEKGF